MIPRKLAYRAWHACLATEADILRHMTADPRLRRQDRRGRAGSTADQARNRLARADRLDRAAAVLDGWIERHGSAGGEVPAELVGLICALIYGDGPTTVELRRRAIGRLDGVHPSEVIEWIAILLET